MASRASSASEGEVIEAQDKANNISQPLDTTTNDPDRVFGLDGTLDNYGRNYRKYSRSPSPYRHTHIRSSSPYRRNRNRERSPSPFRHNRGNRGNDGGHSRSHHNKRKASPPRGSRPDKRHHSDRGKYGDGRPSDSRNGDRRNKSYHDDARAEPSHDHRKKIEERHYPQPISYEDYENPSAVPDFRNGGRQETRRLQGRNGIQPENNPEKPGSITQMSEKVSPTPGSQQSQTKESKLYSPLHSQNTPSPISNHRSAVGDEPEYSLKPAIEDTAPSEEAREAKKRRWAALRAAEKEKAKENLLQQALLANASENTTPNVASPAQHVESPISPSASPRVPEFDSAPGSPDVMAIDKQGGVSEGNSPSNDGPSAADYDPTQDMLDDRHRAEQKANQSELPSGAYNETDPKLLSTNPEGKLAPAKKKKKELDMFASDDDSNDSDDEDEAQGTVLDENLLDNWDDSEGYYKIISNELVNAGRYKVIKCIGRGVFANVAQAVDVKTGGEVKKRNTVAIKMIRRNDLMRRASLKEMEFLRTLNEADPQDRRHIIRLLGSFEHKRHLCLVFEQLSKNLRDLLKEETSGHGLSLQAVKAYARQIFNGLLHLQSCNVIHLDLKPDNILVSEDKKTIKLCDFGTATDKRDFTERSEYQVSRFYRAPEIILGMEIGFGVDMWAIGCTIYELWTGKILFGGNSNNQMIKAFIDCLGWPSEKLLKKGTWANIYAHFEIGPPLRFRSFEADKYDNKKVVIRLIEQQRKVRRDLKTRVHDAAQGIAQGGPSSSELNAFADLLGATLNMNVEKRIQPKDALTHKFFGNNPTSKSTVLKPAMVKRPGAHLKR